MAAYKTVDVIAEFAGNIIDTETSFDTNSIDVSVEILPKYKTVDVIAELANSVININETFVSRFIDTTVDFVTKTDHSKYGGPFEVTPTQETQILHTESTLVPRDITINPIPSNYGLITWNGVTLTVS